MDLKATGDFNSAARMSEEAVDIARRLTAGNPANAGEAVANLNNHARQLRAAGRFGVSPASRTGSQEIRGNDQ